ncbi:hypothetical protein FAES_3931 [Fibrella aestuarina BUZ 2]|uniref:Uncharacterized protein n=1 Tax=Fibrella aestuarina BUZ 2 TaxID=1166018 RepID=I0KCT4_9BACT|nr:hypothetical protein [Fibrella aestuarina]CCH01937.1 hypothetical protein FAES_3931 [Fibrella aestuarina BUZ 2]
MLTAPTPENTGKIQHGKRWMPIMYVTYFGILQAIAQQHGYALAVHGSVVRDFDLVMVPFAPKVSPHDFVLEDIRQAIGNTGPTSEVFDQVGQDCHGRTLYAIECGSGGYFDICFTPTVEQVLALIETDARRAKEIQHILKQTSSDEPIQPQQVVADDDPVKQASYHYKEYMRLMATLWEKPK